MRDADALVQVVRGFPDPASGDAADPGRDIAAFAGELVLADLAIVEKRLERLRKEKGKESEAELLARCAVALEAETPLRRLALSPPEERSLSGYGLLSRLPLLVLVNVGESDAAAPLAAAVRTRLEVDEVPALARAPRSDEIGALARRPARRPRRPLAESARTGLQAAHAADLITSLNARIGKAGARVAAAATCRARRRQDPWIHRGGFIRAQWPYDATPSVPGPTPGRAATPGKLRPWARDYVVRDGTSSTSASTSKWPARAFARR